MKTQTKARQYFLASKSLKSCKGSITWILSARTSRPYTFAARVLAIAPVCLTQFMATVCSQDPNS